MALIDGWLQKRLANYTAISTAAGTAVKVYPIYAPQGVAEPFITFMRNGTERNYTTKGNDGQPRVTFEINCWDTNYARLKTFADEVRTAIDGYREDTTDFQVRRATIEDERDIPDPSDWGFEQPTYGVQFVLDVSHTETVPAYVS